MPPGARETKSRFKENMKLLASMIILLLLSGCVTMNRCSYCHQNRESDFERNEQIDIGDGLYKCVNTQKWIRIEHKATRTDWEEWSNK